MIIKEIELENIRSYRHEIVKLPSGTILFEGDIGSGKTTILMAIEFALFGNSTREMYERLLRKGAREGFVRVKFEIDGVEYEIFRNLVKKGKSIRNEESYTITPEGKIPLSATGIRTYVLGLMGIDVRSRKRRSLPIVTYAIYTPQETMKSILEGRDEERLEVIRKIFRLDEYRVARENAEIVVRKLEGERSAADILEGEKDRVEREMKDLEERIADRIERIKELEKIEKDAKERVKNLVSEVETLESLREKYESLTREIERLRAKMEQMEKSRERLERELRDIERVEGEISNFKEAAEEYEKLRDEREALEEKVRNLEILEREKLVLEDRLRRMEEEARRKGELNEKLKELEKRVREIEEKMEKIGDIESNINEYDAMLQSLMVALKRNEEKRAEKEKELREYEELGARCPVCKRPLSQDDKERLIKEAKNEVRKIEDSIKTVMGKIERVKSFKREAQEKKRELEKLKTERAKIGSDLENVRKRMAEVEKIEREREEVTKNLKSLEEKVRELLPVRERMKEVERKMKDLEGKWRAYINLKAQVERKDRVLEDLKDLAEKIESAQERVKSLEREISQMNYDRERYENLRKEMEEEKMQLARIIERRENIRKEIENLRRERDDKREILAKMEEKIKRAKKLEEIKNWMREKFEPALEDIEKMRLAAINDEFRMLFEEWFHELLGESDYDATVDENFAPIVRYETYDMPLGTLSGGERTSVALAYRLALNTMVKKALGLSTNLLILDEPTDGFSKDQLYKLKDILEKIDTDQIIIVSHEKELRNLADTIFIVRKENGESHVRRV